MAGIGWQEILIIVLLIIIVAAALRLRNKA